VLDVLPRHGPPEFRYTGCDPSVPVWNLGWPIAEFIYDPRFGLQVGPCAFLVIFAQFFVFGCGVVIVLAIHWFIHKRRRVRRGFPVVRIAGALISSAMVLVLFGWLGLANFWLLLLCMIVFGSARFRPLFRRSGADA
jgi:hypothetical protein